MPIIKRKLNNADSAVGARHTAPLQQSLVLIILIAFACAAVGYSRVVQASQGYILAQVTPTADPQMGNVGAGGAESGAGNAPEAQATAEGQIDPENPEAVATDGLAPLPTGAVDMTDLLPGPSVPVADSGDSFPWLIVGGVTILALAGLAFAAMRPRRPAEAPVAGAEQVRHRPDAHLTAEAPKSSTAIAAATAAKAATAAMVKCPNCGTNNAADEKYCKECGQDLRSAPAAAVPPPVDVVDASTPYLETLDRTDEQLEFVLSRPKVAIGTASGNDIVIDAAFNGWETASPQHAELRREQDGFVIVDRESENGTFVNDMRTGENLLSDGDLLRLGDVKFVFRVPKVG